MSSKCLCRLCTGINRSIVARNGRILPVPHSFIPVSISHRGLQMSAVLSSPCEDYVASLASEYVAFI